MSVKWITRVLGSLATMLVHALLLQSLPLGTLAKKSAPDALGPGASSILRRRLMDESRDRAPSRSKRRVVH